ncbi:MAG: hypothetical protein KIT72_07325 [Polyangiaceae bacterium]|nr:hypothetical protein [Polyangiaceae bacterium]MCW5790214.1 hypothetical protein [Polyangiaceae bacterium]
MRWDVGAYPWVAAGLVSVPAEGLEQRITAPPGFSRVALEPATFGAWLRGLPVEPEGTPVRSYAGDTIRSASSVAAVVALDVGKADLQQCADAIMRLHAEWRWSTGAREHRYRSASGLSLEFSRWQRGERLVAEGPKLSWVPSGRARAADHATLRSFLDAVFAWTNTVALGRQAKAVSFDELRPGDFVVQGGNPGHAVLVLDEARAVDGRRALLLGQSYMPAQSFHVLRAPAQHRLEGAHPGWFAVAADEVLQTPFWPQPFRWSELRRLD